MKNEARNFFFLNQIPPFLLPEFFFSDFKNETNRGKKSSHKILWERRKENGVKKEKKQRKNQKIKNQQKKNNKEKTYNKKEKEKGKGKKFSQNYLIIHF